MGTNAGLSRPGGCAMTAVGASGWRAVTAGSASRSPRRDRDTARIPTRLDPVDVSAPPCSGRLACIDIPALPLQILVRRHRDWSASPVAVVDEDKPQGVVLWTNEAARRAGIRVGLRYAAALGLCSVLRAGVVAAKEIESSVGELTKQLRRFTPGVEPCAGEPGVFWLDGRGLGGHFASPRAWVDSIWNDVRQAGWTAAIACGFDRFATYATVKSQPARPHVFATEAAEKSALQRTPLDRLGIEPAVREELAKLGVRTVADFVRLPAAGVLRRFDAATHRLHRMAAGTVAIPMQSSPELEPVRVEADLDPAESDLERLLFRIKQLLDPLLDRLEREGRAAIEVQLQLVFEARHTGPRAARATAP